MGEYKVADRCLQQQPKRFPSIIAGLLAALAFPTSISRERVGMWKEHARVIVRSVSEIMDYLEYRQAEHKKECPELSDYTKIDERYGFDSGTLDEIIREVKLSFCDRGIVKNLSVIANNSDFGWAIRSQCIKPLEILSTADSRSQHEFQTLKGDTLIATLKKESKANVEKNIRKIDGYEYRNREARMKTAQKMWDLD